MAFSHWSPGAALGVVCQRCLRRAVLPPEEVERAVAVRPDLPASRFRCMRCGRPGGHARALRSDADLKKFWAEGRN
jgi:hypothetical protein